MDSGADGFAERFDVMRGGVADVDQEITVHLRDLGATDLQAATAGSVDQFPGAVAGRILEGRAAGLFPDRLCGLAVGLHVKMIEGSTPLLR